MKKLLFLILLFSLLSQKVLFSEDIKVKSEPYTLSKFILYPNFPNPFNPTTSISYELSQTTHVNLTVFDLQGHRITPLVNEVQHSGYYCKIWDACNVAAGIYFYRLRINDGYMVTKKMVCLR